MVFLLVLCFPATGGTLDTPGTTFILMFSFGFVITLITGGCATRSSDVRFDFVCISGLFPSVSPVADLGDASTLGTDDSDWGGGIIAELLLLLPHLKKLEAISRKDTEFVAGTLALLWDVSKTVGDVAETLF